MMNESNLKLIQFWLVFFCTGTSLQNPSLDSFRILNSVLSFSRLVAHSSLFVPLSLASTLWRKVGPPLSFPHLQYRVCYKPLYIYRLKCWSLWLARSAGMKFTADLVASYQKVLTGHSSTCAYECRGAMDAHEVKFRCTQWTHADAPLYDW